MSEMKCLVYTYPELRYLVKKRLGSLKKYADALGISAVALNEKLQGRSQFTQGEIAKTQQLFNLTPEEVWQIFFANKVKEI